MIKGFLDNDLYKYTMQQAVWFDYSDHDAEYTLITRGQDFRANADFTRAFQTQLQHLESLHLLPGERRYLESLPYFNQGYLDMLEKYRFDLQELDWEVDADGRLSLAVRGPWLRTILWEVPLLALVSECYFHCVKPASGDSLSDYRKRSLKKAETLIKGGCRFADFGTRRRYSANHQREMIKAMVTADSQFKGDGAFTGTSNVHFAREFGVPPIGTVAHEWIMAHEVMYGVEYANRRAMHQWLNLYRETAATALSDTYTTELFLDNFDRSLAAEKYDGIRQDSGDPEHFLETLIGHLEKLGIDPAKKHIIFSDGLNPERCVELLDRANGRIAVSFGIGTNLTNDIPGNRPLDIVIKLTGFDGQPVVKIPDDVSKATGDKDKCRELETRIRNHLKMKS